MKLPPKNKIITCAIAGERLGFSAAYIRRLILDGKIKAEKIGHDWIMTEKDIKHIVRRRQSRKGVDNNVDSATKDS